MYKYQIAKEVFWEYIKRDDSEPDDYQVWLAKKLTAHTEPADEFDGICSRCGYDERLQQDGK